MKNNINNGVEPIEINSWYVIKMVGNIGLIIALPLIVMLLIGRWVDTLIGSKILFTLIGIVVGLLSSSYTIYQKIKRINR